MAAAAAAAVAVDPLDEIRVVLTGPIGLSAQCANRFLSVAGIARLDDFEMFMPNDAETIIKRHNEANQSAANRQFILGIVPQKKLQGFLYWYHDKAKRNLAINTAEFTVAVMKTSMEMDRAETAAAEVEQKELNPGPIDTGIGYFDWADRVESAMIAMKGRSGQGPLFRVIRPDQPPGWVAPNPTIQLCYDLPLEGIGFDIDNQQTFQLIQRWTIKDPIYNWLKVHELTENGRGAWMSLKAQLEGSASINGRVNEAQRILGSGQGAAFWTNEYTFKFVDYSTQLQRAYTIYEKCDNVVTPAPTRVRRLLDGMKPNDKQVLIQIAKSYVADNLLRDWIGACQYLQAKVDEAFPPKKTYGNNKRGFRQVSQTGSSNRGGRGGRGNGKRGKRGGR